MLNSNLTIADWSETDHQYNLIRQEPNRSVRLRIDEPTPGQHETITISHNVSGKGPTLTDRHLVQHTLLSTVPGAPPLIVNLVMAVPQQGGFDASYVANALTKILNLLTDNAAKSDGFNVTDLAGDIGNWEAVLRGES